jgi:hypothetical protein
MNTYSRLLNRYYDSEKVVYLVNMLQVARYMKNGAEEYLVDILWDKAKKEDSLVFVFEKSPLIKELYRKWNAHELN